MRLHSSPETWRHFPSITSMSVGRSPLSVGNRGRPRVSAKTNESRVKKNVRTAKEFDLGTPFCYSGMYRVVMKQRTNISCFRWRRRPKSNLARLLGPNQAHTNSTLSFLLRPSLLVGLKKNFNRNPFFRFLILWGLGPQIRFLRLFH